MQPAEYLPSQWVVHMSRCRIPAGCDGYSDPTMEIKHCALLEATLDAMWD